MEKRIFNEKDYYNEFIHGIYSVAQHAAFNVIPKFWNLRNERMQAEEKFLEEQHLKIQEAQQLLSKMAIIASKIFKTEFSVEEVDPNSPLESMHSLCSQLTSAYFQEISFPLKMYRAKKFKKSMHESFGIITKENKPFEIFQNLIAKYSSRYMQLFDGIGDKYYNEVTKRKIAEQEAEHSVVVMLKKNHTRDLIGMWESGDEQEAYNNCLKIMIEYQSYKQNIPKSQIKELSYDFEYYDEKLEKMVKVTRETINVEHISCSMS